MTPKSQATAQRDCTLTLLFLPHRQPSHRDSNKPFARGLARTGEKEAISETRMQPPPQKSRGREQERNIRSIPAASLKATALLLLCSLGAAPAPKPRNPRVVKLAGWGRKKQSAFFILLQVTIQKKKKKVCVQASLVCFLLLMNIPKKRCFLSEL